MHPDQPRPTPSGKCGLGQARRGAQEGEARKERLLGVRAVAPACQPSPLSLPLLSGVPLLFVIPWGIVKYLYEDEG